MALFDSLAVKYDAWFDSEEGKKLFPLELEAVKQLVEGEPKPWVEIGVGSGRFAEKLGVEFGLDPSEELLKIAKRRGIKVKKGIGEMMPFDDESFGMVLLVVTICFVEEPETVLKEAHRILKENGSVVVGLVPAKSKWGQLYIEKGKKGHPFYSFAKFYAVEDVKKMMEKTGFGSFECRSTLYFEPESEQFSEEIKQECDETAGFVVIKGRKLREQLIKKVICC